MSDLVELIETGRRKASRTEFEETQALAAKDGGKVCAYIDDDGTPRYFVMPSDATETSVRDEAFRRRYGREASPTERDLLAILEKQATR